MRVDRLQYKHEEGQVLISLHEGQCQPEEAPRFLRPCVSPMRV